jgi:hypothetical protein
MNIPKTLTEIQRILVGGGSVSLSLHLPSFTMHELVHQAIPKPVSTLLRLYVMANGLWFHCTGQTLGSDGEDGIVSDCARNADRAESCRIRRFFLQAVARRSRRLYCGTRKSKGIREAEAARAA